jgi:DNA-binding transcriptional regulator PaaX
MRIQTSPRTQSSWLLLILSAPGQQPALRMRLWRGLKALGVGVVRDGVYVLPNRAGLRDSLQAQANEVIAAGGTAQILDVQGPGSEFVALLDRTADYARLIKEIQSASNRLKKLKKNELGRTIDKLRRDFEDLANLSGCRAATSKRRHRSIDTSHQSNPRARRASRRGRPD